MSPSNIKKLYCYFERTDVDYKFPCLVSNYDDTNNTVIKLTILAKKLLNKDK